MFGVVSSVPCNVSFSRTWRESSLVRGSLLNAIKDVCSFGTDVVAATYLEK